jgi:hypothetical protein
MFRAEGLSQDRGEEKLMYNFGGKVKKKETTRKT